MPLDSTVRDESIRRRHGANSDYDGFRAAIAGTWRELPPIDKARVTAAYAGCAVRTARELGADMARLGAETGLDLSHDPPDDMPVRTWLAFLDAAARHLNDPLFGMQIGRRSRVTDAKAYSVVLVSRANVRSVVEQATRFEPLAHDLDRSELTESGALARRS